MPEPTLLPTLRRAARDLTPVVVDVGVGQPKLAGWVDAVLGDRAERMVRISPIAADAIPPASTTGLIRVRSTDDQQPWMLTAHRIEADGPTAARISLTGAVISRLAPRAARPARGLEPLVLIVPTGAGPTEETVEAHVFPVVDAGAQHCAIEATEPLTPGARLDPVELVGDRRVLRRCGATVVETIPWVTAEGRRVFRCRMALDESHVRDDAPVYDLVSDPARIVRLLELAAMVETRGWYDARGARGTMRIGSLASDHLTIGIDESPIALREPPATLTLGFTLFAIHYELEVRVIHHLGAMIETALPLVVRRKRRRSRERTEIRRAGDVTVSFRNPATAARESRVVRDVSFGGLSFESDRGRDVLWAGLPLEDAVIESAGGRIALGDLEVRGLSHGASGQTCRTRIVSPACTDDTAMIDLIATHRHPDCEIHDGGDFRGMLDLYRRAGLLSDWMIENLTPVALSAAVNWTKLHQHGQRVARTLVYQADGGPQAAVTAVRAWEHTWFAQHFGAVATHAGRATGVLQLAYVDHVLPRPDAHFLAFFVKAENARMNAFYERFFAFTGTPEAVQRVTLDLWVRRESDPVAAEPAAPIEVRPARKSDGTLIWRAGERALGALTAAALSLAPGEVTLPGTAKRFAQADLIRRRRVEIASSGGRPSFVVMQEETSPGVNLTWMLDACWILPVHAESEADSAALRAVARRAATEGRATPAGDRFVIVPQGIGSKELAEAGMRKVLSAHLYVFNRAGLHRYYHYIADRYGEVAALTGRRAAIKAARGTA